jgi:hypothetical protein
MKKLGLLLSLLTLPGLAFGQASGTASFSVTTTQNLTGSAPTLSTDGADLTNALGFIVTVTANTGQTITGGSLLCYYYGAVSTAGGNAATKRWMRCPTTLDFTPATGAQDAPSGDFQTLVGYGRIQYVPSSVTVSSGTTVGVTITVRKRVQL